MSSMQQQLGVLGTISAFAYRLRETKKNLCRGGRLQDLPDTDFQPPIQQHIAKQYTRGNKDTHKIITQYTRPTTVSSNAHRKSNIMERKYCTQFLILLLHRQSALILTGPSLHFTLLHFTSLHFTSTSVNTLHGTPRFTPLHCTTLHFT